MASEFNFERAWRDLARPEFLALPKAVRGLYLASRADSVDWFQGEDLDIPFPDALRAAFEPISSYDLAVAAHVTYFWGHWAHRGDATLQCVGGPDGAAEQAEPTVYPAKKHGGGSGAWRAAERFKAALQATNPDTMWEVTQVRHGPSDTHGSHWEFSNLVDQELSRRLGIARGDTQGRADFYVHEGTYRKKTRIPGGQRNDDLCWATSEMVQRYNAFSATYHGRSKASDAFIEQARDHLLEGDAHRAWFTVSADFMDHKDGTKYSLDELPKLLQPKVDGLFRIMAVNSVNFEPHMFLITNRYMAAAQPENGGTRVLEADAAPCGVQDCMLSYAQHTFDTVAFLQCLRDITPKEAQDALKGLVDDFKEHSIDGVTFVEHPQGFKVREDELPIEPSA